MVSVFQKACSKGRSLHYFFLFSPIKSEPPEPCTVNRKPLIASMLSSTTPLSIFPFGGGGGLFPLNPEPKTLNSVQPKP